MYMTINTIQKMFIFSAFESVDFFFPPTRFDLEELSS
jgi:hypothetical protein